MEDRHGLQVIFFADKSTKDVVWIGQCIDFDLNAQGKDFKEAASAFKQAVNEQYVLDKHFGVEPFSQLLPTPTTYRDMFEQGDPIQRNIMDGVPTGSTAEKAQEIMRAESRVI